MPAIATRERCRHCGGTLFYKDEDGQTQCLLCARPYYGWSEYGKKGGLRTVELYGKERMRELGRRGGLAGRLPTLAEVRQQQALEIQSKLKGGRLPNRLSELKELWKLRNKNGELGSFETAPNSPERSGIEV